MNATSRRSTRPTGRVRPVWQWLVGIVVGPIVAVLVNLAVVAGAIALGGNPDFPPFGAAPITTYTVGGFIIGLVGWVVVRRFVRRADIALAILVPVLTVASFVFDIPFFADPQGGALEAVSLMVTHVVVVTVGVSVYRWLAPVRRPPTAS